jgi:hypothetical protein
MQNSYSDHRKLDSANQSYKFGKNYAVSAIKRTICNTSNAATRFHVILCSPFQNDNVVENIPGIANCLYREEFVCIEAASLMLHRILASNPSILPSPNPRSPTPKTPCYAG